MKKGHKSEYFDVMHEIRDPVMMSFASMSTISIEARLQVIIYCSRKKLISWDIDLKYRLTNYIPCFLHMNIKRTVAN